MQMFEQRVHSVSLWTMSTETIFSFGHGSLQVGNDSTKRFQWKFCCYNSWK